MDIKFKRNMLRTIAHEALLRMFNKKMQIFLSIGFARFYPISDHLGPVLVNGGNFKFKIKHFWLHIWILHKSLAYV